MVSVSSHIIRENFHPIIRPWITFTCRSWPASCCVRSLSSLPVWKLVLFLRVNLQSSPRSWKIPFVVWLLTVLRWSCRALQGPERSTLPFCPVDPDLNCNTQQNIYVLKWPVYSCHGSLHTGRDLWIHLDILFKIEGESERQNYCVSTGPQNYFLLK